VVIAIRHLQSAFRNPQSAIQNRLTFAIHLKLMYDLFDSNARARMTQSMKEVVCAHCRFPRGAMRISRTQIPQKKFLAETSD